MSTYSLTFSRLSGEFTVDKELIGQQDPYVIFESGGNKCQTKAIKNVGVGTAEWKETYTLREFTTKTSSILEITVLNHNTLRPDGAIGSGRVDLARLSESQLSGSGERVKVQLIDKKEKSVGFLQFYINGGGYTGAGRSTGTTSGTSGYTSGSTATGTGAGYSSGSTTTGTGAGYTSGSTTTGTGAGYTSGGTTGAGYTSGGTTGAGYTSGGNTGAGYTSGGTTGSGTGGITGVGAGSTYSEAKAAADKAALQQKDVTTSSGATGRPVGTDGYDTSSATRTSVTGSLTGTSSVSTTGFKASGIRGVDVSAGEIIDRKYYTGIEVRPQDQALIERHREHAPYAKQYETTVCHTGRERLIRSNIEALGTTERVIEMDHLVHSHPHDQILRALPKGAVETRVTGEGWIDGLAGPVCETSRFEITGDRIIVKERVTNLREHREFEKEFEVKTILIGERNLPSIETEQLHRERVLVGEKQKIPCEGHPIVDTSSYHGGVVRSESYITRSSVTGTTTGASGYRSSETSAPVASTTGTGYNSGNTTSSATGVNSGTTRDQQTTGTSATRTPQYA